jgi:hypothetical protein
VVLDTRLATELRQFERAADALRLAQGGARTTKKSPSVLFLGRAAIFAFIDAGGAEHAVEPMCNRKG